MLPLVWFIVISIVLLFLSFGAFIDWKRKKMNNYPHRGPNLDNKPGESKNYRMGDHENHTGGL